MSDYTHEELKPIELGEEELGSVAGGGRSGGSTNVGDPKRYLIWEEEAAYYGFHFYVLFPCPSCGSISNGRYSLHAGDGECSSAKVFINYVNIHCMECFRYIRAMAADDGRILE